MDPADPHARASVKECTVEPRRSARVKSKREVVECEAADHKLRPTNNKRKRLSVIDVTTGEKSSSNTKVQRDNGFSTTNSKAKQTTKSSDGLTGHVIDLTEEDDVGTSGPSKKSKMPKSNKREEKRLKKVRTQAPSTYQVFVQRAMTQRMVVIDRRRFNNHDCPHRNSTCPIEEVDLAGSTGNVYTIRITHIPECTCPDFKIRKNPQCKHILYVLLKVLKAPENLYYQAAFLTSELQEIFEHAGPLPTETVHAEDNDGKRKPVEGDCPICCEELSSETEAIVWCKAACGNNLHKTCFDQWAATKGHSQVTCPYCRTQWQNDLADGSTLKGLAKIGTKNRDGYVNVADHVGLPRSRDYSTYHDYWVHRQRRYGLLDDEEDYGEEDYGEVDYDED